MLTEDGVERDTLALRFGMRDFTVTQGQFYLNGDPIYLRGVLLQPNYPVTLIAPPDREMMVRELTLVKSAGFNLIRAHIWPTPPGWLDLADELGLLVYAETPLAWIRDNPRLMDHARREIQALVERDRNHPSVVFWGIYNENPSITALTGDALLRFTRGLDPTRVIVDNSGGTLAIDQDFGWVDRASVMPNRASDPEPIPDVHIYVGAPVTPGVYEWLRTVGTATPTIDIVAEGYGSRPILEEFYRGLRGYQGKIFVSELGYGGMADLDAVVAGYGEQRGLVDAQEMETFRADLHAGFAKRHLERAFGSVSDLIAASQDLQAATLTRQIEAVLINRRVSGFVVTQLNDVSWEFHAGLLDHWRNPKRAYFAMHRLNGPHCVVLHAERPAANPGDRIRVHLTLVDRSPLTGHERLALRITDPAGTVIATDSRPVPPGEGIKELGQVAVQIGTVTGNYTIEATLEHAGEVLARSNERIWALPAVGAQEWPEAGDWPENPAGVHAVTFPGENTAQVLLVAMPSTLTTEEWESYLTAVETGKTGLLGALAPADEVARQALKRHGLEVVLHLGFGSWMGCYHWMPEGELFAGLPTRTLAGDPYAGVTPQYSLSELGGEVLAGALQNTKMRKEPAKMLWFSDIEVVSLGRGKIIFCQYRAFDRAKTNPVAARQACNLLRLARRDYS